MAETDIVERLRIAGWSVAVHNDYSITVDDGENVEKHRNTFWLFTHPSGVWAKGEGRTDAEALAAVETQTAARLASQARVKELEAQLNTPELHDFSAGVVSEAQHQRARWGSDHDAGKDDADWFWLVGYLAGKALSAAKAGDSHKALHHCISTAAALANWHAALAGTHNAMRPGIDDSALKQKP